MHQRARSALATLFQTIQNFRANQFGNVGIMFGLAALPIFLGAGAAIDYSRIASAKSNLVASLDSAALFAGAVVGKTDAQLTELARNYVNQNYGVGSDAPLTAFSLKSYTDRVEVKGTVKVKTWFMSVGGVPSIEVNGQSEIAKSGTSIEVSLVLDVTGSMDGSPLASLKTAANNFIDTIVPTGQTTFYSKVAIVPFADAVNMGDRVVDARGPLTEGVCSTPSCTSYTFEGLDPWNQKPRLYTTVATTCVSERIGPEKYTDAAASSNPVGRHYYVTARTCAYIPPVVPLTTDKSQLHDTIDALKANGGTAGQIGMAWGWYTLSPNFGIWSGSSIPAPYPTKGEKLKKISIFMTDGAFGVAYCNGVVEYMLCPATNGGPTAQAASLCSAMKAKGITVYTIGFKLDDPVADTFLKNCASDGSKYFDADNDAGLKAAFEEIAINLVELRISQ